MSPTFINIGPGRCATSWLHEILLAHPEITMANVKETEYFNNNFQLGDAWYEKHFPDEGKVVAGEISNCYYTEREVAQRIFQYNPAMKIMINVRDPYSLMQSFHGFGIRRGLDLGNLDESLHEHIGKLMGSGYDYRKRRGVLTEGDSISLLDSVKLSERLRPFFDMFPREQIYVFDYERMKTEQEKVLVEIYDFLNVDSQFVPPVADKVVNASITPKSKMVAKTATQVSYFLRRMGCYKILSVLHKSRLIKKVFYSNQSARTAEKVDPRVVLNADTRRQLDAEIHRLMEMLPELQESWAHLLPKDVDASELRAESVG